LVKYRNYWIYSTGCFVVWAVLLIVVSAKGHHDTAHNVFLIFGGWAIAWISNTIAPSVYPPPKRWR
jgi:hypothetical protein